jgi:hypothetical protein
MGVGVAGLILTGISAGELISYQAYRNDLTTCQTNCTVNYQTFESRGNTATIFNVLIYVGAGIALGGLGGAALTW